MDVLDVGRMAVFADPVGAVFSVWQAGTHPGAQLVNEPGTWSWSELLTTDVEASKAFYGEVFGWTRRHRRATARPASTPSGRSSGRSVGGMMQKPPMMPAEVPPFWARVLRGRGHRRRGRAGHGARRHGADAADGHRARPLRRRRRSRRWRVQRDHAQARARRTSAFDAHGTVAMARPRGAKARATRWCASGSRSEYPDAECALDPRRRVPAPRRDDPLGADHRRERQQGHARAVRAVPDAGRPRRRRSRRRRAARVPDRLLPRRRPRTCSAWRACSTTTSTARCPPSSTTS